MNMLYHLAANHLVTQHDCYVLTGPKDVLRFRMLKHNQTLSSLGGTVPSELPSCVKTSLRR